MSQSVGFNWGFKPNSSPTCQSQSNSWKITKSRPKRRLTNEEFTTTSPTGGKCRLNSKRKVATPAIRGQALPLSRAVEMMDRQGLQSTLLELLKLHPEIQSTFMAIQPASRNVDQYLEVLKNKLELVYANVPYSKRCDEFDGGLNDYAFVRVKSHVIEFLNCLVDCLLESIPPQTTNLMHSLKVLDLATELLSQVPQFSTASNNYYKNVCYQQVAEIWVTVVKEVTEDITFSASQTNLLHWLQRLQEHNGQSQGKLTKPLSLLKGFLDRLDTLETQASTPQDQQNPTIWSNIV
ncbi:LAFE_0D06084g1_1 [Lachancea fermentati]|uniref:Tethering factor for nuclear proteasome STS1 n=1 Tax=Lachancea fermentati TaxID=4955 RepID=A0A1G4MBF6_LACFM|nr:LAFE_0D06084g1_1 [Lachancea fermentati]